MKYVNCVKNNIWASTLIIFILFFCIYGSIYFFIDGISAPDDHFFHIKIAQLLKERGLSVINGFNWYPIKEGRLDLSLFQISLIPFTFFDDLFVGLRVSDAFGAALSLSTIYFALRKFKFKYSFLGTLILFSSTTFSFRLFVGRGYILTLGIILLEVYFMQKKEYLKFFWIALVHVLWHRSSFFFPIIVAFLSEIARYLSENKIKWKAFVAPVLATVLGMAFFPDFPSNIFSWIHNLLHLTSEASGGLKLEGNELYVKKGLDMLKDDKIFYLLLTISAVLAIYSYIKMKKENSPISDDQKEKLTEIFSFFLLLVVIDLGAMTISGRFYDYYFIFVVMLLFSVLRLAFISKEIIINEKILKYLIFACFIFFSYSSLNSYSDLRMKVANSDYKTIKAPVEWIRDNSEEKEMVYLFNWSDFTKAFFYNDKNIYSWGIEPKVLTNKDPKLYWKAYNIMAYSIYCEKQEDCEVEAKNIRDKYAKLSEEDQKKLKKENSRKIINSIKNDFGSRFILSSNTNFSDLIRLNDDSIEDQFEAVSEKDDNRKITAFKLK